MWTLHRGNIWWDKEGNNPWLRLHRVVIWGVVRPHPGWFLGVRCPVSRVWGPLAYVGTSVETTGLCGHTGRWCRPECRHHCLALPHPTHHSTLAAVAARTSRRSHLYSYITRDTALIQCYSQAVTVQCNHTLQCDKKVELQTNVCENFTITENAPTRDMRVG